MRNPITAKYIQALVVADGFPEVFGITFGPKPGEDSDFTLNFFLKALQTAIPGVEVTKAHRRTDSNADPGWTSFDFTQTNLSGFDEIWLFGYEGSNGGAVPADHTPISAGEIAAITDFMNGGGGVFATGDHSGMGSLMCGLIPRVRSMRAWFDGDPNAPPPPPGYPTNAPPFGHTRLDTTQPDSNNEFWFDNQSDAIPQPLSVPNPHPVLQDRQGGLITQFPDHMHEGEVIEPLDMFKKDPKEYPPVVPGAHRWPEIIAWGTVLPDHKTPLEAGTLEPWAKDPFKDDTTIYKQFGVVGVYNGLPADVGRVVTDSSFHHFLDLNLTGDPLAATVDKVYGFQNNTAAGKAVLDGMTSYYRNIAYWIARQRNFFPPLIGFILIQPWWGKVFNPLGPVETNPEQILQYGGLMRQGLARHVSDTMTIDYVRLMLADAGLTALLPEQPWKRAQEAPYPYTGSIVDAAMGGMAMELMAAIAHSPKGELSLEQAQAAARKGMLTAMRALKGLLLQNAKKTEALAARLVLQETRTKER